MVPAKYLVTPSISNIKPLVFAKAVDVGPVVDVVLVDEVLDFTVVDDEVVLTEDEDVVEVVLTVDEVDVLDVVAGAEVAVPGTHW